MAYMNASPPNKCCSAPVGSGNRGQTLATPKQPGVSQTQAPLIIVEVRVKVEDVAVNEAGTTGS